MSGAIHDYYGYEIRGTTNETGRHVRHIKGITVCHFFLEHRCRYPNDCWYAHPQDRDSRPGDNVGGDSTVSDSLFGGKKPNTIYHSSNVEVGMEESECIVCFSRYDDDVHRPRVMPCGHTTCSKCLGMSIRGESKMCPKCRTHYSASNVEEVPINYSLEGMVKSLKISENTKDAQTECPEHQLPMSFRCAAHKAWICQSCLIEDHSSDSCEVITIAEELSNKISRHRDLSKPFINRFEEACKNAIHYRKQYKKLINRYEEDIIMHENMIARLQKEIQRKKMAKKKMEADFTINTVDHLTEQRNSYDQAITSLESSKSIREVSKSSVEVQTESKKLEIYSNCIEDVIDQIKEALKIKDDHILGFPKLSVRDGKPHLHGFQYNIQVNGENKVEDCEDDDIANEEIKCETAPPKTDGIVTFLDIAWPGQKPQRLYIKMISNSTLARQYLNLITGQWGTSYRGLYFYGHGEKGQPGEVLIIKTYKEKTKPLVFRESLNNANLKHEPGTLFGCGLDQGIINSFGFCITNRPGNEKLGGFGQVISGLEILQDVAKSDELCNIEIVDCGVVLYR